MPLQNSKQNVKKLSSPLQIETGAVVVELLIVYKLLIDLLQLENYQVVAGVVFEAFCADGLAVFSTDVDQVFGGMELALEGIDLGAHQGRMSADELKKDVVFMYRFHISGVCAIACRAFNATFAIVDILKTMRSEGVRSLQYQRTMIRLVEFEKADGTTECLFVHFKMMKINRTKLNKAETICGFLMFEIVIT
jgi:hypothetical protein